MERKPMGSALGKESRNEVLKRLAGQGNRTPQIKVCGLTRSVEADFLNEARVEYAGIVLFRQSKRYVPFKQAEAILKRLSPGIKRVAVLVSPGLGLCRQAKEAGFDFLQIHGKLQEDVMAHAPLPIWRACNIEGMGELCCLERHRNIAAYLIDAKSAGSGRTFDWSIGDQIAEKKRQYFDGKLFVLAGGLHSGNVKEGIAVFQPDIVDVSSGVETEEGKQQEKIQAFVKNVRGIIV